MVIALAATAATALVQAMVTDGWEGVRQKVARLFGRGKPDAQTEKRLDATQRELVSVAPGELAAAQSRLAAQWETRFGDLLTDHPDAEQELAALVEELKAYAPVVAADHSVAAGRDVNIKAESGSVAAGVIHGNVALPGPMPPGPAQG
jgi:hypothetical protein